MRPSALAGGSWAGARRRRRGGREGREGRERGRSLRMGIGGGSSSGTMQDDRSNSMKSSAFS